MRQFNIFRGTKGWLWLYERQLRLASMNNLKEAERRLRILIFWEKHGGETTGEAFGIPRRTLYRWQARLRAGEGKIQGLDKKSTAPKVKRIRRITHELETKILDLRRNHHRLGKKKVAALCSISESKAGRILGDLKRRGLLPQNKRLTWNARHHTFRELSVKKKPKLRRPKIRKQGLEIDTVVRFIGGTKRYIYTAIDVNRRFAFGGAYSNHSSESASDFLTKMISVAPFRVTYVQTDNGSEFAHLFQDACKKRGITHYHTYPRCPKMNGTVERFNRTISEDFIQHHLPLLRDDITRFNERMIDWLLWYNTERPHESLGMLSPLQYIVKDLSARECHMWWTRTFYCLKCGFLLSFRPWHT